MRLVQFQLPEKGRRIGYIDGEGVVDLTSINAEWTRIYNLFLEARRSGKTIDAYLAATPTETADRVLYNQLLTGRPGDAPKLVAESERPCLLLSRLLLQDAGYRRIDRPHDQRNVPFHNSRFLKGNRFQG